MGNWLAFRSPEPPETTMRPTERLSADHRLIEQVLDCLDRLCQVAPTSGALDFERAHLALRFLGEFADHLHHGKEEKLLFPAMQRCGIPGNVGPIAVMLNEHDLGRAEVARMRMALLQHDTPGFKAAAGAYVEILRDHIGKEDGVLFPMAEERFGDDERRVLEEGFERADRELLGEGVREALVDMANRLAADLGVPHGAARPQTPRSHSCGLGYS
jgi:hemerythrin-like domain-containing protein